MHAVIKCGGKQFMISEGDRIKVERLDSGIGDTVEISDVLALGSGADFSAGEPVRKKAMVVAEVIAHGKNARVTAYKFRRRKNSSTKRGHRQDFTEILIKEIKG